MSGVTVGAVRWLTGGDVVALGWIDWPVTIVYLLVFMNIINLIDGLDGLAAGITAIVSLGLLYLVTMRGSFILAMFCVALAASCIAFLRYNFHPASVFMGDSGSLFLGALLAVISISGVVRMQGMAMMLIPLIIAGVPLLDTVSAIVRRWRVGRRIGQADMGHLHHRLVRAGLSQKRSVATLYACSLVMTLAGCFMSGMSGVARWVALVVLGVAVGAAVWKLHLFDPVLQHYYRRRSKSEPRRDTFQDDEELAEDAVEGEAPEGYAIMQDAAEGDAR